MKYSILALSLLSILFYYQSARSQANCNAIYETEMARALNDLRGEVTTINDIEARRYMLMLKQQRDIEQQILNFEQLFFRSNVNSIISQLHVPLNNYINCQLTIVQGISMQATETTSGTTVSTCDARYQQDMAGVLATGTGVANIISEIQTGRPENIDIGQAARNYMIALKQQRDLNQQIQDIERNRFNSDIIARLRTPLNRYNDCYTTYFSNTELVRTNVPTTVEMSREY